MRHNKQLSPEDRETIRVCLEQELSLTEIGNKINRDKSVISRELSRNTDENGEYVACNAQELYQERKKRCGAKRKLENARICHRETRSKPLVTRADCGTCKTGEKVFFSFL